MFVVKYVIQIQCKWSGLCIFQYLVLYCQGFTLRCNETFHFLSINLFNFAFGNDTEQVKSSLI